MNRDLSRGFDPAARRHALPAGAAHSDFGGQAWFHRNGIERRLQLGQRGRVGRRLASAMLEGAAQALPVAAFQGLAVRDGVRPRSAYHGYGEATALYAAAC